MTDNPVGEPVTIAEQQHPNDEPRTPASRVDLARTDANRVAALVQIARDGHTEARDSGEAADRLQAAFFALYDRIASKSGDRRTRLDRALHGLDGSLDEQAVLEYLDLTGREGLTARRALQKILDGRTLPEFDGGQDISDRLHGLAYSWEREDRAHEAPSGARPALPPAGAAPVKEVRLQRREPIRPEQPPEFPPAPPETPAQQTGEIIRALRDEGFEISPAQESAARKDHQAGPNLGPAPDPSFSASALPQARAMGDTAVLPLSPFFGDDVETGDAEAAGEPRPFPGADTGPQRSDAKGKGDGDDES